MKTLEVLDANSENQVINTIPDNGQATMANSQPVTLASDQPPIPVTGTFDVDFPAVQTVALQGSVPVTGTFYPATQPVTGTFWQATQPISGSVTVLGTQVVSGTVALDAPTLAALENITATVTGPLAVTGTFFQAEQPVSLASQPLPTGAATQATLASIAAAMGNVGDTFNAVSPASIMAGVRRDSDAPLGADGQITPFTFNALARLRVSATQADTAPTLGSITTNGGIVAMDCARQGSISISMIAASLVGHNVSFEVSNDATSGTTGQWYGVQVVRTNANVVEGASGVLTTTPAYMWQVNVSDYSWFRVRATAHTSGTAAYILSPSSFPTEAIPASQNTTTAQLVDTELPAAAALADGATNPTTPTVGAAMLMYNGTTNDRFRANINTLTGDTGAKTATFNGATQTNYNADGANIVINVGAVTGTTPNMVVKAQFSADNGTTWVDIPGAVTANITVTGQYVLSIYPGIALVANQSVSFPLSRTWRLVYTISGTTPSFTLTNVQVAYVN